MEQLFEPMGPNRTTIFGTNIWAVTVDQICVDIILDSTVVA